MKKTQKKLLFDFVLALSCLFAVLASNDAHGASVAEGGDSYFLSDLKLQAAAEIFLEYGVDPELVEQLLRAGLMVDDRSTEMDRQDDNKDLAVIRLAEDLEVGLISLEEALLSINLGCPPYRKCLLLAPGVALY